MPKIATRCSRTVDAHFVLGCFAEICTSRSLQSICKDMDFMIRFRREASDGEDHGCEGDFGKEVCCAAER